MWIFREIGFVILIRRMKKNIPIQFGGYTYDNVSFLKKSKEDQKVVFKAHFNNFISLENGDFDDADYLLFRHYAKVQHPKLVWIFLINFLLGSTFIFWAVAFFWAFAPGKVSR